MNLKHLDEIVGLAKDYKHLSRAMRQAELCWSMDWTCTANGHEVQVNAADMGKIFTEMRNKVEGNLRNLGVTEFEE